MEVNKREVCGSRNNCSGGEGIAKRQMKLLRARGTVELGKVSSGSATHGLWLGDRKVEYQVVGKDRSRLLRRGTVMKVRKEGK